MPPANSRAHSPLPVDPTTTTTSSSGTYLSALRQIDSIPVPDLASTLHLSSQQQQGPFTAATAHGQYRDAAAAAAAEYDDDAANDANVSFLRTHLDPQEEWRAQNADAWEELQHRHRQRDRDGGPAGGGRRRGGGGGDASSVASGGSSSTGAMVAGQGNGGEDRARRERLQRVLNRLNRMHSWSSSPWAAGGPAATTTTRQMLQGAREAAYGAGTPQENSLYDWSPMGDPGRGDARAEQQQQQQQQGEEGAEQDEEQDDDEDQDHDQELEDELRAERDVERAAVLIYTQLRRDQPNTHPDVLRATARARAREQIELERDAARRRAYGSILSSHGGGADSHTSLAEQPLRNQALLQSVRRHPRFSPRPREYMQRYVIDRERYQHDSDERDRWQEQRARWSSNASGWPQSPLRNTDADGYDLPRMAWQYHPSTAATDGQSGGRSRSAYRRMYLDNPARTRPADKAPEPSEWLQNTITYLAQLRDCTDYEDALSRAVDADFLTKEFMGERQDDFLLDVDDVPRPQQTSWLAPGAVFSGSQHATSGYAGRGDAEPPGSSVGSSATIPQHIWQNMTSSERRAQERREARRAELLGTLDRHSAAANEAGGQHAPRQQPSRTAPDRWPVKVTVHAVDWDRMTVAATMEAYNVPHSSGSYSSIISAANSASASTADAEMTDAPAPGPQQPKTGGGGGGTATGSTSITTYLEGEIIDFTEHTLLTESYPSDRRNDALYWRKLAPFSRLPTDDDMTRLLVSKRALADLNSKYVLMRWKERCFIPAAPVHQTTNSAARSGGSGSSGSSSSAAWDGARPWMNQGDAVVAEAGEGCGLTISGFYYVCLRREDGEVEGLYCDPESSPYQHLRLARVGGGCFPTWSFA